MTARDWLAWLAAQPLWVGGYLLALPLCALALGLALRRGAGNDSAWKYVYSALVYCACVPGIFGALVTAYLILFTNQNLLDVNALVTLAPVASAAPTLGIASRSVDFGPLPGFGRLSGLMVTIGLSFLVVFALTRTRVWIVFGGSMALLAGIGAFVFALLKWGSYMTFRRHDEAEKAPPRPGE